MKAKSCSNSANPSFLKKNKDFLKMVMRDHLDETKKKWVEILKLTFYLLVPDLVLT